MTCHDRGVGFKFKCINGASKLKRMQESWFSLYWSYALDAVYTFSKYVKGKS